MRIEDIRYEFPEMPEDIKNMVKMEVEKQLRTDKTGEGSGMHRAGKSASSRRNARRLSTRRAVFIGAAAVMAFGTTAFAGSRLYRMYSEQLGNYGAKSLVTVAETEADTAPLAENIPDVKLKLNYLPEGMVQSSDSLKYHYDTEDGMKGGISIAAYSMDTGDDAFEVTDINVLEREDLNRSGRDIIYLQKQRTPSGETTSSTLYVFFPEVHHVLQMWCGPDVAKEEALRTAEGIELVPLEEGETPDIGLNWAWSLASEQETETEKLYEPSGNPDSPLLASGKAHSIGELFPLSSQSLTSPDLAEELQSGEASAGAASMQAAEKPQDSEVSAKVVSVQTAEDLGLLGGSEYIDPAWLEATDESGMLLPNDLQYIKRGDGIDTLDEIVMTQKIPRRLVYATVEYTNTGDTVQNDFLFFARLHSACEVDGGYSSFTRTAPGDDVEWDFTSNSDGVAFLSGEMGFYDYRSSGDHNGGNYIDVLNPGETVTIHMAWIVNEDELPYLYLDFGADSRDAASWVDIRQ